MHECYRWTQNLSSMCYEANDNSQTKLLVRMTHKQQFSHYQIASIWLNIMGTVIRDVFNFFYKFQNIVYSKIASKYRRSFHKLQIRSRVPYFDMHFVTTSFQKHDNHECPIIVQNVSEWKRTITVFLKMKPLNFSIQFFPFMADLQILSSVSSTDEK